jgi:hypothetical protein
MNFIIDERARNYIGKATEDKIYSFNKCNYNWAWKGSIANGTSFGTNLNVFHYLAHPL